MSMLARLISASDLVLVLYVGAFAVPLLYSSYRQQIDPVVKDGLQQVPGQGDSLAFPHLKPTSLFHVSCRPKPSSRKWTAAPKLPASRF